MLAIKTVIKYIESIGWIWDLHFISLYRSKEYFRKKTLQKKKKKKR